MVTRCRSNQRQPAAWLAVLLLVPAGWLPAAETWSHEFKLRDVMRIYDFPEQRVNFAVKFPAKKVRPGGLQLVAIEKDGARPVRFQLSGVVRDGKFLKQATVSFRSDLPKGSDRRFRLSFDSDRSLPPLDAASTVGVRDVKGGTAVLWANRLRVRVPHGTRQFQPPVSPATVPAPILAVARDGKTDGWCLAGSFRCQGGLKVIAMETRVLEQGPLFVRYRVAYTFDKGQQYIVVLTVEHNERHVTLDEKLGGISPQDETYLQIDLAGVDPDRREVMSNGGYGAQGYCGAFDKKLEPDGRVPFELGLNRPNSMGVMRAAAFYADKGDHSLLFALYRLKDWKTVYRHVWYGNAGPGNLRFYARDGRRFCETRLEGGGRHWALALIPRDEQVHVRNTPGGKGRGPAGGPEVRLWQKLADFNLDQVKDWVFDWDETDKPARLFPDGGVISYDQWIKSYGLGATWWFLNAVVNFYWDFSAEVGPPSYGLMPEFFGNYERSRSSWTPEQREHVRGILLFLANTAEDDNNLPHHSMLAGQPNFVMQVKQTVPIACGVFPNHPHARRWRDSFMGFYREWLDAYGRPADREHNAAGGRWTENIACYSGTSLQAVLRCARGLEILDGTRLLDHPMMHDWVRWYLLSFMSPHDGVRRVPPEGAHAGAFAVGGGYWQSLFEIARRIEKSAPGLSARMRWIETSGKEGIRPRLESVLVRDYGPVLRYDFGGPHESYLHLMQTSGRYNYRWGAGSGVLYFGARNRNWSYNGAEANGDRFDINQVSAFSVAGKGLGYHPTDQPLFDFGDVQFYRAVASPEHAGRTAYHSRGILLVRDEYIAVFDDVEGRAGGRFTWSSGGTMPEILQLQPGVKPHESSTESVRRYDGRGDFLTLVAPAAINAKATRAGAVVGRERLLFADQEIDVSHKGLKFRGRVGLARPGRLALFDGTRLGLDGLEIVREGGDFGVSVTLGDGEVTGRVAGRRGGTVALRLPVRFKPAKVRVDVDGRRVDSTVRDGAIRFAVAVSQREGYKRFRVRFKLEAKETP